jgi:4-amino-4-deoxy-L-arabinose transferase-like glycosyltransferase
LTLLLVFLWGSRDFSRPVGLLAAAGLVTSTQFMITSRWIVSDPLLMLFTTIAFWSGSDLLRGRGRSSTLIYFYAALILAMWTKGLIGPVLVASGVLAYLAARRELKPLWSLRPFMGAGIMVLAMAALMALIYADSGFDAVREWFWVNHVQRFIHPVGTGHERPFYEYFIYLPTALFPWWIPFIDLFRPSTWRDRSAPEYDLNRYLAALSVGMFVILSASSTKRGLYLMPMLPPLFLLLSSRVMAWWRRQPQEGPLRGAAWWLQVGLVLLFAAGPTILVMAYLRNFDAAGIAFLVIIGLLAAATVVYSRRGDRSRALAAFGSCAIAAILVLTLVDFRLAGTIKNMSPFLTEIKPRLSGDQSIYVTGDIDETLRGIVPFVMERDIVEISPDELHDLHPDCVIVQAKHGRKSAPAIDPDYELQQDQSFGPGRYLGFWCLTGKS